MRVTGERGSRDVSTRDLMRDVGECIRSREVAEAHFVAELSNDADEILKSMKSYDPLLTSVVVGVDADSALLVRCGTRQEQHAFYAASRAQNHIRRVDLFTSIGGEWYGFVHGLVTTESLATADRSLTELVGLLPVTADEDTVAGEVGLSWPLVVGKQGDAPGEVARERIETVRVHDAWLEALRSGDAQRIGELYAPSATLAMRHPITGEITSREGPEAIAAFFAELFERLTVTAADIVLRVVDRWFVFAEVVVRFRDREHGELVARLADICVVGADDTILVHLGSSPGPATP